MDFSTIIEHMNDHHKEDLKSLCKKFANESQVDEVSLESVDFEGLNISYDDKNLKVKFPQKADENTIKDMIIKLCTDAKEKKDLSHINKEIQAFIDEFNSVCMATLSKDNEVMCSYAPFIKSQYGFFIYISEASEHFLNIKNNPKNIEIMFLEDESKAASCILRKRLRYKCEIEFTQRNEKFDQIYDEFENQTGEDHGIKMIRNMQDFHLIKLNFKEGRFVKGFGQAYDLKDGCISQAKGQSPHNYHKK
ncbi:HugZ family heme oxygenase [Campylobacter volucris]|uniref:HugZ family heme oxygenase n=1 Tax=Campylobacter volucris TaxID=1031542 RepID=A0A5C7DR09_9BACT|nr:HugZ family heme oxygenase [Campylobacter volucris]TXE88368.1 HugZ family heme oxygenase [Campylobacter volucris]